MLRSKFYIFISITILISCNSPTEVNRLNESEISFATDSFFLTNSNMLGSLHRIEREGFEVYTDCHGHFDISESRLLEPDDLFAIGSITKTFTATIIMQLVEDGIIDLNSPCINYLPVDIRAIIESLEYGQFIDVIHLLNHTSGIFSYTWIEQFYTDRYADFSRHFTVYDILNYVTEYGWAVNYPGEEHHYSNTNFVLLGVIIENVTGESYTHNLEQRIINPLNLYNTFLVEGMLSNYQNEIIHGYDFDYGEVVDIHQFDFGAGNWAAGGIISNCEDLNKFFKSLCEGELYDNSTTFQSMLDLDGDDWFGLGIFKFEHPLHGYYYGHGGGHQGTNSFAAYFPAIELNYSCCITVNGQGGYINPEDELEIILNNLE